MQKPEEINANKGDADQSPALQSSSSFDSIVLLKPEQMIADRYRVISLLGSGGMGCVYRVSDNRDGLEYALKTLNSAQVSAVAWLRLQKEAKAAQLLNHPTIVKVYEFGLIEDRQPFFVMDLFQGDTLSHIIKNSGPLPLERALDIFIEVCLGLGYAHEKGVIHRDIKCSNIMVMQPEQTESQSRTQAKIVDFGIAKVLTAHEGESLNLTRTGEVFGTPFYMSPEQCLGVALDSRSDIYSLGCVMFEALTGLPPFMGDTALSTMMKHQTEKPPTLKEGSLGKEFPDALEKVIARMLEKDPRMRYRTLSDVATDLRSIQGGQHSGTHLASWLKDADKEAIRNRGLPSAAIFLAVLAVLGTTFAVGRLTAPQSVNNVAPKLDATPDPVFSYFFNGKLDPSKEPFSSRIFRFPATFCLGTITASSLETKMSRYVDGKWKPQANGCVAQGNVAIENFSPLNVYVTTNLELADQLGQFNRFQDGELRALVFSHFFDCRGDVLKSIAPRKDVRIVDFDACCGGLKRSSVDWINDRIPNLEELIVTGTKVEGDCIMHVKRIGLLKTFVLEAVLPVSPILEQLKNSSNIQALGLRIDKLSDSDLSLIASMKNLIRLDIGGNEKLTARGLSRLTALRKLKSLNLDGVPVPPEQIAAALKGMRLEQLVLKQKNWTPEQTIALKNAFPQCEITTPQHMPSDIKAVGHDVELDLGRDLGRVDGNL